MRRPIVLIAALAVVVVSCSSGTDAATPAVEASSTTAVAQSEPDVSTSATTVPDTAPSETDTVPESEAPPETAAPVDGPPAPDFTMTLNDGSEFTLSAEQKPVYIVFWAEW